MLIWAGTIADQWSFSLLNSCVQLCSYHSHSQLLTLRVGYQWLFVIVFFLRDFSFLTLEIDWRHYELTQYHLFSFHVKLKGVDKKTSHLNSCSAHISASLHWIIKILVSTPHNERCIMWGRHKNFKDPMYRR